MNKMNLKDLLKIDNIIKIALVITIATTLTLNLDFTIQNNNVINELVQQTEDIQKNITEIDKSQRDSLKIQKQILKEVD